MFEQAVMSTKTNAVKAGELRVPVPLYRHAAPSAPWPWMDLKHDSREVVAQAEDEKVALAWRGYPQSLFGNWTPEQMKRSRMFAVTAEGEGECKTGCMVHRVDVFGRGVFRVPGEIGSVSGDDAVGDEPSQEAFWMRLGALPPTGVRLRAFFVACMSEPVLKMLGMRYNIEPFFFSSSANWIPSRYQEDVQPGKGDHITVVLPFVRVVRNDVTDGEWVTDTQLPLRLAGHNTLIQDLLAVHMVRTTSLDTILSYHPDSTLRRGSAALLRSLLRRTGDSVYWSNLYEECSDPTIVLLALIWHAVYAWDEALEVLYDYLNKTLEAKELTGELITHTRELHKVRAHLIYYQQLLRDFRASIAFLKTTPNPAMDAASVTEHERTRAAKILQSELDNLVAEIERLDKQREIQTNRVVNATSLALSTMENDYMKAMNALIMGTMQDSAIMKQISYFTLVFLPPYFMATIFRMNIKEINPIAHETLLGYVEATVIFTLCTAWLVIALQDPSSFHPGGRHILRRLAWPVCYGSAMLCRAMGSGAETRNRTRSRLERAKKRL